MDAIGAHPGNGFAEGCDQTLLLGLEQDAKGADHMQSDQFGNIAANALVDNDARRTHFLRHGEGIALTPVQIEQHSRQVGGQNFHDAYPAQVTQIGHRNRPTGGAFVDDRFNDVNLATNRADSRSSCRTPANAISGVVLEKIMPF